MPDAATNITVSSAHDHAASAWDALPYLYLLRVQLITFLALLSFPFLALWFAPNLLLGVFDVMPWGMVFVTLGATLASWTVMVTAWQVFLYGPERFHIREFPFGSSMLRQLPTRVGHSPVFALFSLPVILTAMYVSKNGGTSTYLQSLLSSPSSVPASKRTEYPLTRAITWRSGHSCCASWSTWPSASENSSA